MHDVTFSEDIFSGRTMTQRYPLTAAARASPIPVFPDVGSMIVSPCNVQGLIEFHKERISSK